MDNYIPSWIATFQVALRSREIAFPNHDARRRFVQFFYSHANRSPDFSQPIVEKVKDEVFSEEGLSDIESRLRPLTASEKENFCAPEYQDRVTANSRVQNFGRYSEDVISRLRKMTVIVATPSSERKQFIVGSNPVIRFESYKGQELGSPGVELWTALTPSIAVGFAKPMKRCANVLNLSTEQVRLFNTQIAKYSTSIASRSDVLLESVANNSW